MKRSHDLPALSESQLEVMHVVWRLGEATLGEIWTELSHQRPLAKNTVQTLLTRMVDKGWLAYRNEGNAFIYRGTREKDTAHRQILQRVLDVAFQGSTEGLLVSLLENTSISSEEAKRLRALIDEAEKEGPMIFQFFDFENPFHRAVLQGFVGVAVLTLVALVWSRLMADRPVGRQLVAVGALVACVLLPIGSFYAALNNKVLIPIPIKSVSQQPVADSVFEEVAVDASTVPETQAATPQPFIVDVPAWLGWIYLTGVLIGTVRLCLGLSRTRRLVMNARAISPQLSAILDWQSTGGHRVFSKIVQSPDVNAPIVTGHFRPVLVFPEDLLMPLDAEGLRQVVRHEETHVKRGHLWTSLLQRVSTILLWPVPTVFALNREAVQAQEDICDWAAVEAGTAATYARMLVAFAERSTIARITAVTCGILDPRFPLEARIRGILDPQRRTTTTMKPITKAAVLGATFATMTLLAGTQIVFAQTAQTEKAPEAPLAPVVIVRERAPKAATYVVQTRKTSTRKSKRSKNSRVKPVVIYEGVPMPPRAVAPVAAGAGRTSTAAPVVVTNGEARRIPILGDLPIVGRLLQSKPSPKASRVITRPAKGSSVTYTTVALPTGAYAAPKYRVTASRPTAARTYVRTGKYESDQLATPAATVITKSGYYVTVAPAGGPVRTYQDTTETAKVQEAKRQDELKAIQDQRRAKDEQRLAELEDEKARVDQKSALVEQREAKRRADVELELAKEDRLVSERALATGTRIAPRYIVRSGSGTTVIHGATVIIQGDGTVVISGGRKAIHHKVTKPKHKVTKSSSKPKSK